MTVGRWLLLLGFAFLLIVVLTHRRRNAPRISRHGVGLAKQSWSLPRSRQCRAWLDVFDRRRGTARRKITIAAAKSMEASKKPRVM
jgi:hypothetical protein